MKKSVSLLDRLVGAGNGCSDDRNEKNRLQEFKNYSSETEGNRYFTGAAPDAYFSRQYCAHQLGAKVR